MDGEGGPPKSRQKQQMLRDKREFHSVNQLRNGRGEGPKIKKTFADIICVRPPNGIWP